MDKAYLVGIVNLMGPMPVITGVRIMSESAMNTSRAGMGTTYVDIISVTGKDFQTAHDNMVIMVRDFPFLSWVRALMADDFASYAQREVINRRDETIQELRKEVKALKKPVNDELTKAFGILLGPQS
jgi:hypothetical protein